MDQEEQNSVVTTNPKETNTWAMLIHLSVLSGFIIPFAGLVVPIVLWQLKKNELPGIDPHGKMVTNWLISATLYGLGCFLLSFIIIGIPLMFILAVLCVIFPIIGGIKANEGELWKYPLTIEILK